MSSQTITDIIESFLSFKYEKLVADILPEIVSIGKTEYEKILTTGQISYDLSKVYEEFIQMCYNGNEKDKILLILLIFMNNLIKHNYDEELIENIANSICNFISEKYEVKIEITDIRVQVNKNIEITSFQKLGIIHLMSVITSSTNLKGKFPSSISSDSSDTGKFLFSITNSNGNIFLNASQ